MAKHFVHYYFLDISYMILFQGPILLFLFKANTCTQDMKVTNTITLYFSNIKENLLRELSFCMISIRTCLIIVDVPCEKDQLYCICIFSSLS